MKSVSSKILPVISLIIIILVIINEIQWLGKSGVAKVLIGLAVSNGLLALNQILRES